MIKINLSSRAKSNFDLGNVAGFNLRLVNVRTLLIAFLVYYAGDYFLVDMTQNEISTLNNQKSELLRTQKKLKKEEKGLDLIKKQIEALKYQEQKLVERLEVVKKVLRVKNNPFSFMKYLAEKIPQDVWVTEFDLQKSNFTITGNALSYSVIGSFIESIKLTTLVRKNTVQLVEARSEKNDVLKRNVEYFKIKGTLQKTN